MSKPHDLVLRDLGFRMDLLVDGVLADQEWPIGQVAESGAHIAEQSASVHSLNIAEGVLPDSEVEEEDGGVKTIRIREGRMFGAEDKCLQYWRPAVITPMPAI